MELLADPRFPDLETALDDKIRILVEFGYSSVEIDALVARSVI